MNIKPYTGASGLSAYTRAAVPGKSVIPSPRRDGNFDQVSLTRAQTTDDTTFARTMAKELAAKISAGASPESVMELKRQVADGTYVPNSGRIAERMLGYR